MKAIKYRIMDSIEDMLEVEQLQQTVWGMSPADAISAATMRWMVHIGGLLLGAWDTDSCIGFNIGMPGKREDKWIFWSDMMGIHPDYQGQGIGYRLKMRQREWAQQQGYEQIRWTFDPMQRGNASFNFQKLGVISYLYHPAFYGHMQDELNMGLPADRLEAVWSTNDSTSPIHKTRDDMPFVVEYNDGAVKMHLIDNSCVRIQIPISLSDLKKENLQLAIRWQEFVRSSFLTYLSRGYQVIGFDQDDNHCWYLLVQSSRD